MVIPEAYVVHPVFDAAERGEAEQGDDRMWLGVNNGVICGGESKIEWVSRPRTT